MRYTILTTLCLVSISFGQNCGPQFQNETCAPGKCCSSAGWCDTGPAWCDPATCQPTFSGPSSPCSFPPKNTTATTTTAPSSSSSAPAPRSPYASSIPNIDVCGHASANISCPGAGIPPSPSLPGYYYRCCSADGHCGPKNPLESQSLYCGADTCQPGFGDCATNRTVPPAAGAWSAPPTVAGAGETCGPIVNARCADGLCCSGSNYCGSTVDFCGAANWCQELWGHCAD